MDFTIEEDVHQQYRIKGEIKFKVTEIVLPFDRKGSA